MRILVIEDEHRIARAIKEGLEGESYAVDLCFTGDEGLRTVLADEYDVVLLDVMLPGMNGFEVCKETRRAGNHTPILMLTAKDQPRDIVDGLNAGADDYVAKPFSFEVLLARIRALLRRPHGSVSDVLTVGDLVLNLAAHEVKRAGTSIQLSSKEYALLEYLMRNQGRVVSKQTIITHVWDFDANILPNTVEVFINYLRAKIEKPFRGPMLIHTVRGFGYKMST